MPAAKWKHVYPRIDPLLHDLYVNRAGQGHNGFSVKPLAERLGLPTFVLKHRAVILGLARTKEFPWSEKEIKILERFAHRHPEVIQRKLKCAGFHRSMTGIVLKRKRLRLCKNHGGWSLTQLALAFGEDQHKISLWVNTGLLRAEHCGTKRLPQQGGDRYFIKPAWVKAFIVQNIAEVDLRKADKYFIVDVLTGPS
jgi:hypothetical protein